MEAPIDIRDEDVPSPLPQNNAYRPLLGSNMTSRPGYVYGLNTSQSPLESRPRPLSVSQQSPAGTTPGSRHTDENHSQHQVGASVRSNSPSAIDSMTAVVDEEASTREFFGISSAGSFTAQIKKAIDVRLGKPGNGPSRPATSSSRSFMGAVRTGDMGAPDVSYVLPPRRQADHLMKLYWFYVDPLYPFLDKQRWTCAYNAIFAGTAIDFDERTFVATLNIVLALSTQLHESQTLEQREQSSNAYFRRAQDLLPMSPWDSGSLELVQCLLVTSQYLQSTHHPHQTWMLVGSAIRTAQSLGLHLPETSADRPDVGERELLRRIWYGCVLMDRVDDTLQARFVEQGALFCVSTAQSIITTLLTHQTLDSTVGLLPAWWYRVYYVYSAATVLIAATLRPEVFLAADIGRSWGQAISVLKAHEKFGPSARRCVAALHILSSKILQAVPNGAIASSMGRRKAQIGLNEQVQQDAIYDATSDPELPDLLQRLADEFAPPIADLNQHDLAEFTFDVNDLSWLTDMQVAWELLNE
ncbi:hypothetical protein QQZ08_002767 [Neonectria magnoliae]|uniref:Xylanolytic transcriptional activator regulatory domain-containing protein n=1 Tax=Neonectria magnoliae TaxID=2732573 RepID=A0ABR1IAT8_9HYPO